MTIFLIGSSKVFSLKSTSVSTVGLIYAATGTVNMAELAGGFNELSEPVQMALGVLLLSVFAVKAALFPFFFWLPDSYPTAPIAVTAARARPARRGARIRAHARGGSPSDGPTRTGHP